MKKPSAHIKPITTRIALLLTIASLAAPVQADAEETRNYIFGWPFVDAADMQPRGATTRGPLPELATGPSPAWRALQEPGLSDFERDRRAILAMAGDYRVSFDFLEIAGFTEDYRPDRPYRSWGTEFIDVITDKGDFISLQHVLVMRVEDEDGNISEPIVTKHWRQDWQHQAEQMHAYTGNGTWQRQRLSASQRQGRWIQSVYQVDDSPRYAAAGAWEHTPGRSSWISDETWRPLPRREFTARDDYQVLVGTNRQTITPAGWIHEQNNLKAVLNGNGELDAAQPYLAQEISVNRYQPIIDHDFSAGRDYWANTAAYWAEVRAAWDDLFRQHDRLQVSTTVDDKRLFSRMFKLAEDLSDADRQEMRNAIDQVLVDHVAAADARSGN